MEAGHTGSQGGGCPTGRDLLNAKQIGKLYSVQGSWKPPKLEMTWAMGGPPGVLWKPKARGEGATSGVQLRVQR